MKACPKCGATRFLAEFRRDGKNRDGYSAQCKPCRYLSDVAWKRRNPEHVRAYFRRYAKDHLPDRAARLREWRRKNPEKYRAHVVIQCAVARGAIVRPMACEGCGAAGRLEAHHADYSKPMDVRWLCRGCHVIHDPRPQRAPRGTQPMTTALLKRAGQEVT